MNSDMRVQKRALDTLKSVTSRALRTHETPEHTKVLECLMKNETALASKISEQKKLYKNVEKKLDALSSETDAKKKDKLVKDLVAIVRSIALTTSEKTMLVEAYQKCAEQLADAYIAKEQKQAEFMLRKVEQLASIAS